MPMPKNLLEVLKTSSQAIQKLWLFKILHQKDTYMYYSTARNNLRFFFVYSVLNKGFVKIILVPSTEEKKYCKHTQINMNNATELDIYYIKINHIHLYHHDHTQ